MIMSIFLIIALIVTTKYISPKENIIYAINVGETLSLLGRDNYINIALKEEIRVFEEKKADEIVEKAREAKRVEEEAKRKLEKKRQEELKEKERIEDEKNRDKERNKIKGAKNDGSKTAYLTFDDGPSLKATPLILDILNEYDIKATFFVLGSMAENNPDMLKRIHEEGHKIGNHSYSHNYKYIYKSVDNFLQDFKRSEDVLKAILGEEFDTKMIRFPGGSFGKQKAPMKIAAVEVGYNYFDWNSLNGDSERVKLNKSFLMNRLKATVGNKNEAIILMHDTDSKMETVETLRDSIEYLIGQGFNFKVLK